MEESYVEHIFRQYELPLMYFFRYYAMQQLKSVTRELDKDLERMELGAWIKFGHHTNIIPAVLTSEEMTIIYRALEKESLEDHKDEEDTGTVTKAKIDFNHFKRGLVRILILAK